MFVLRNVQLSKNGQLILQNISLKMEAGEMLGIIGPSGSGKSSLLRLLNLLNSPGGGEIMYQGKNILSCQPVKLRREVGYIPQKPYLFGEKTGDNLEYPYTLLGREPDKREMIQYLERTGLSADILAKKPTELSGGEQQRIALIRSLLIKPKVVLLDEVTASLDNETTSAIERLVVAEKESRNLLVVFVSHNLGQVKRMSSRVVKIAGGTAVFDGMPEEYFTNQGGQENE